MSEKKAPESVYVVTGCRYIVISLKIWLEIVVNKSSPLGI